MPSAAPDALSDIPPPDPAAVARFGAALEKQHRSLADRTPEDRIGIAVSGGADSLALLLLATAALPGRIEAATVDHGLRPESASEAAMVAGVCGRLGVPHAILEGMWDSHAREGLQAAARDYRYRELTAWCGKRHLRLLATAHHADDQAETLLMRIARGAGVGGLGAIRPVRRLDAGLGGPVDLVRPLLGFAKRDLRAIVGAAGLVPVEDASNDDPRFDRTSARRLLAGADWLDPARLAATASHMADADAALWWAAKEAFARRIAHKIDERGRAHWLLDPEGLPDEIVRRLIRLLIDEIEAGATTGPTGPELTRFIARLEAGESATLGHILARPGPRWRFAVAPPRKT